MSNELDRDEQAKALAAQYGQQLGDAGVTQDKTAQQEHQGVQPATPADVSPEAQQYRYDQPMQQQPQSEADIASQYGQPSAAEKQAEPQQEPGA